MKKNILSIHKNIVLIGVIVGLIGSSVPGTAFAVPPGQRAQSALEMLQKYSEKASSGVQKLIACMLGKDTCTKEEIRNTRNYIGIIGAALAILAVGGAWRYMRGRESDVSQDVPLPDPSAPVPPQQPEPQPAPQPTDVPVAPQPAPAQPAPQPQPGESNQSFAARVQAWIDEQIDQGNLDDMAAYWKQLPEVVRSGVQAILPTERFPFIKKIKESLQRIKAPAEEPAE